MSPSSQFSSQPGWGSGARGVSRLLVVEDEQHIAAGLRFNLEAESYAVTVREDGESALRACRDSRDPFDLIVLDVMLPGISGFDVVQALRDEGNFVPVLMLTARGRPEDVVNGFAAGADDYLPKPFELAVLLARIQALLRRTYWARHARPPAKPEPLDGLPVCFELDDKVILFDDLKILDGDREIPLTLMESNLLKYLIEREGRTVSRKSLLEDVWGLHEDTDTRAIDNFIVRLRRYLEDDPHNPRRLVTVRGVGYRFERGDR